MTPQDMIENIRATFAMEDLRMSAQDEARGRAILEGSAGVDQMVAEIKSRYIKVAKAI